MKERTIFQSAVASWLSMKSWVKIWLFFLNAVFLLAFAFLPSPEAVWTLIAYAASGPLLVIGIMRARGLNRLLGLAHLIPWLPLLGFLGFRLVQDEGDNPFLSAYLALLFIVVSCCLVLDVYDVFRWLKGERFVLGSSEAHKMGASKLAPAPLPCEPQAI